MLNHTSIICILSHIESQRVTLIVLSLNESLDLYLTTLTHI